MSSHKRSVSSSKMQLHNNNSQFEFVANIFRFTMILKLFHWNTLSYAAHKASDELFQNTLTLMDQFVETYVGKYGRAFVQIPLGSKFDIHTPSGCTEILEIVDGVKIGLQNLHLKDKVDTDLMNIRDSLLGHLNQFLYLMTLQ